MKERGIIFSAPMVRALLEDRKGQTRRILKLPKPACIDEQDLADNAEYYVKCGHCPYGRIGDRLWVRETWMENHSGAEMNGHGQPLYRASWGNVPSGQRWKPSIHMPRWASRITLEITGVRVEKLQDITEADAVAEGIDPQGPYLVEVYEKVGTHSVAQFAALWESIHGEAAWDLNPYLWVISFKRAKP